MEDQEAILSQLVTALQEGLGERPVAVVLYGSRARDQASEASNWDLFVIAKDLPARLWERHILAAPGYVIHPGEVRLPLAPGVVALPFRDL
ncbi:MAG: nucleotidyltransferase domain-containing protein [Proteobacteria bacterium]|nr:nucleotidyltransferase domain-containing protein [Pseudomonadota bacterium]MBU4356046.1 nucleotidyltransferase domain-containing protein [Pseudomonadota bacterium]